MGRLKIVCDADMVAVTLDKPHMQPFYGTVTSLVWHARASDVTDSRVRGKRILIDCNIGGSVKPMLLRL